MTREEVGPDKSSSDPHIQHEYQEKRTKVDAKKRLETREKSDAVKELTEAEQARGNRCRGGGGSAHFNDLGQEKCVKIEMAAGVRGWEGSDLAIGGKGLKKQGQKHAHRQDMGNFSRLSI